MAFNRQVTSDLPPTDTGPTHEAELKYLHSRMEAIRDGLEAANKKHDAEIAVTAILFDSEHFHTKKDDAE